ncbi:MAG: hypothetical protein U5K99_07700 [Anaerolineales bacterium]|nr:hypothetical protein [Anaerolineales bacterium]
MNRYIKLLSVILILGTFLLGCSGESSLKKGWIETSGLKHSRVKYNYFDGVERKIFRAQPGETIHLDLEVEVDQGSLVVKLLDAQGELIWNETFQDDAQETVSIAASEGGRYQIRLEGEAAEGGFEFSWETDS